MIIVTTLYNASDYISKCIETIQSQTYKDFTCYISDDMSTDDSIEVAKKAIGNDRRFVLLKNRSKLYQPGNYDYVIRNNSKIKNTDVVVELDGDDWFADTDVLSRVNNVYNDQDIWIANGSFIYSDGRKGFASKQQITPSLRTSSFTASHIRTWRAGLWRRIKVSDLKNEQGIYWPVAGDLAFMYPMLEMSGQDHYKFMSDINYIYNEETPLNDHKVNMSQVNIVTHKIRNMRPYEQIEKI